MALEDVISLQITLQSSAVELPGFGTPMVLAPATEVPAGFTERLRYYTAAADMVTDGFLTSAQTYKEVVAALSQNPRPDRVAVGRRATPVAQVDTITFALPANSTLYSVTINGKQIDVTTDGSATATELRDAMVAAINGSSDWRVTPVTAAPVSTNQMTLTADAAGIPFTTAVSSESIEALVHTTPSTGIPEDLIAIETEQSDWYMLLLTVRDFWSILTAAAAVEGMSQRRMLIAQSSDAAILATVYDASAASPDIANRLRQLGYGRTALAYHPTDAECLASAWVGQCIGPVPASLTWMFKELAGVTATKLTTTHRANLVSKYGNGYEPVAGRSMTYDGHLANGDWIDITRGIDKLHSRIQALVFGGFMSVPKVPYTQGGIETVAANVRAALEESIQEGLIARSRVIGGKTYTPGYTITTPSIGDISASDRETRLIPAGNPIRFEGTLQGAIHKATINGTLSF